jgi:hypothetical protein
MTRHGVALTLWLTLAALLPAQAPRTAEAARTQEQGTYLGALFSPVSKAPRQQGVLITHVLPDSPAANADLRRHDVLVQYGAEKISDCQQLARLIQKDRPGRKVQLLVLRDNRETPVEVTLGLGPAIKIAPTSRAGPRDADVPRGIAKPGAPPPVSVAATPLEHGKMKVTIEYYQNDTGKFRTITCEGASAEIDSAVEKLPERERNLARIALERIRELNSKKAPSARPSHRP